MAITLGEAIVWLRGNSEGFDNALNTAEQKSKAWAGKIGGLLGKGVSKAADLAVDGINKLADVIEESIGLAGEEQIGIANLAASVKASGGDWDEASGAIEDYLSAELKRVAMDDGDGRESISNLTRMTGDYKEALGLMPLAMDLARAKGMELSAAAEIVGKVHEGNTGILKRYGIAVAEGASAEEALAAMQAQVAGQAEGYANTYKGAQDKMNIALGNLKETVGAALLPALTDLIGKFAVFVMDSLPAIERGIAVVLPWLEKVVSWLGSNIPIAIATLKSWLDTQLIPALTTVWEFIRDKVLPVLSDIGLWLTTNIPKAIDTATTAFNAFKTNVLEPIGLAVGVLASSFQSIVDRINDAIAKLREWLGVSATEPTTTGGAALPPPRTSLYGGAYAAGGDFVVTRPTMVLTGENYQPERVTVTPMNAQAQGDEGAGFNFHYHDYSGMNYNRAESMAREWEYRYQMGLFQR